MSALYDSQNQYLGEIRSQGDRLVAYDNQGRYLGYYESVSDRTYDYSNSLIGYGNLLATLFY